MKWFLDGIRASSFSVSLTQITEQLICTRLRIHPLSSFLSGLLFLGNYRKGLKSCFKLTVRSQTLGHSVQMPPKGANCENRTPQICISLSPAFSVLPPLNYKAQITPPPLVQNNLTSTTPWWIIRVCQVSPSLLKSPPGPNRLTESKTASHKPSTFSFNVLIIQS